MNTENILIGVFTILMGGSIICYDRINHRLGFKFYVTLKMIASAMFLSCGICAICFNFFNQRIIPGYKYLILIGAICGFFGDYLLALVGVKGENLFIAGVGAFGLNQIFIIIAGFIIYPFKIADIFVLLGILIIILSIIKLLKLRFEKKVLFPIIIYMALIGITLTKSISIFYSDSPISAKFILFSLGTALFVISDFILGINKFNKKSYPLLDTLNTLTYFPGQLLIALSLFF